METTSPYLITSDVAVKSNRVYGTLKRVLDVVIALSVLLLFWPLWIVIAALVRLTSAGPALYCQRRAVGQHGREFTVYKFRTMFHNSDDTLHKHAIARFLDGQPLSLDKKQGTGVPVYKLTGDPRITPFGKILRKTGLDEVPQFLNVLRGDMSVVGPRPPLYYEFEKYGEREKRRLSVLPGITGYYQVTARSCVTFQRMVDMDLEYIAHRCIGLDLWIILKTPWIMLTGKGAH